MEHGNPNGHQVEITDDPIVTGGVNTRADCGAIVTFHGVVRNHNDNREVSEIHYECYRELTVTEANRVVDEITDEFDVRSVRLVHRVGDVKVGEVSLYVVVTAGHRRAAFDAIQALVDRIKERLPIWKKERYVDGTSRWL